MNTEYAITMSMEENEDILLEIDEFAVVRGQEVAVGGAAAVAHVIDYGRVSAFFLGSMRKPVRLSLPTERMVTL